MGSEELIKGDRVMFAGIRYDVYSTEKNDVGDVTLKLAVANPVCIEAMRSLVIVTIPQGFTVSTV